MAFSTPGRSFLTRSSRVRFIVLSLLALNFSVDARDVTPARQAATVRVVFETDKGRIEIAVDAAHAPVTSANFLKYVDDGAYDGGVFHRTVRIIRALRRPNP